MKPINSKLDGLLLCALFVFFILLAGLVGRAQTPTLPTTEESPTICLYHPETLARTNPAGRPVIIQVRSTYGTTTADAIPYIRREWASGDPYRQADAIAAAVMYSIALHPYKLQAAKGVPVSSYLYANALTIAPTPTLYDAWFRYMFSGNALQRANSASVLGLAINSPLNRDCNPWRSYQGEWR